MRYTTACCRGYTPSGVCDDRDDNDDGDGDGDGDDDDDGDDGDDDDGDGFCLSSCASAAKFPIPWRE